MKKKFDLKDINTLLYDGMSISVGGFMVNGTSEVIIDAIVNSGVKDLTIVCNDGGYSDRGVGKLISSSQVKKLITSHIGLNPVVGELMSQNKLEVELVPQGTLAEKIRCGGNGLLGFYTPVGVGTDVEKGKEIKEVDGVKYIFETALKTDLSILQGDTIDKKGNMVYKKTSRNFNPLMAMNSKTVIASAKKCVKVGEIDPDIVITPHIFIDYIVMEDC
ncbi:MAG: CoA transferase subunit A [Bacilli bacterium]